MTKQRHLTIVSGAAARSPNPSSSNDLMPNSDLSIMIDPSLDFKALVEQFQDCGGVIDPAITQQHLDAELFKGMQEAWEEPDDLPPSYSSVTRVQCQFFDIRRSMDRSEIVFYMSNRQLWAAGLRECFAFGGTYPHLIEEGSAVCAIRPRRHVGQCLFPMLCRQNGQLALLGLLFRDLFPSNKFSNSWRYLAISKKFGFRAT